MGYPAEYGFIPDTLGVTDPLDALVLSEYPTSRVLIDPNPGHVQHDR